MKLLVWLTWLVLCLGVSAATGSTGSPQFIDGFEGDVIAPDWQYFTGDGNAELSFVAEDGYARMEIDATDDQHNVWWSIIKRNVAPHLDMEKLASPDYELRIEARIRVSDAPRRMWESRWCTIRPSRHWIPSPSTAPLITTLS